MDFIPGAPSGFIRREDFGSDFIFGSSTSAIQVEGALREDGRGPSIWDNFAAKKNLFSPYGEDAVHHYKKYEEDVKIMKDIAGKKESRNQKGIDFYKRLLANLKCHGIEPFVTLLHFDPPQALEEKYGGFLSHKIVDDFCEYAKICFEEFGCQVKYWITMNEPWGLAFAGYITGQFAPGMVTSTKQHCRFLTSDAEEEAASDVDDDDEEASIFPLSRFSFPPSKDLKKLPSGVKAISMAPVSQEVPPVLPSEKIFFEDKCKYPYLVTHHQILAHAKAVKLYREEYQCHQKGKIGIVLVSQHFIPMDDSEKNTKAAQRATDFMLGWFMDPLVYGKYPENMRTYVTKGHLPKFGADKCVVKGSFDFIGLNYYTARYVTYQKSCGGNYVADQRAKFHVKRGEVYIGDEKGPGGWIYA